VRYICRHFTCCTCTCTCILARGRSLYVHTLDRMSLDASESWNAVTTLCPTTIFSHLSTGTESGLIHLQNPPRPQHRRTDHRSVSLNQSVPVREPKPLPRPVIALHVPTISLP
jgi:hypothetical protein